MSAFDEARAARGPSSSSLAASRVASASKGLSYQNSGSTWAGACSKVEDELRRLTSGDPVVNLSIATSESWRDKASGEKKEKTEWHRVVIFNKNIADVAEKYLKKGAKVYIEGQLQTRKWTDKDGAEKYSTEVVLQNFRGELTMLDGRSGGGEGGGFGGGGSRGAGEAPASFQRDEMDDEIPF